MFVIFLRGVNVGGKNKMDMKVLQKDLQQSFNVVKTYLNTGNIILKTDLSKESIESKLNAYILKTFGFEVEMIIRSKSEIKDILDIYPYEKDKNRYITFFKEKVDPRDDLILLKSMKEDQYQFSEKELFLYVPNGYGKSKLTNNYIENAFKVIATTRNYNTVLKVLILMDK